jgi:pilus assembly protein CpaF
MSDPALEQLALPAAPPRFVARRPQAQSSERVDEPSADSPVGTVAPGRGVGFDEFGPLAPLVADASVTDVFVNGPGQLWADRGNGLVRLPPLPLDETQLRDLAVRLIAAGGRHIDEASPCVDVRLRDGIRVHAVLPPISTSGTLLSIRLPAVVRPSVTELDAAGFFRDVPLAFVARVVRERHNILITGASGSGKTTLLAALLSTAAAADRVVAIEDVAELRVDHPHFVSLEARQANLEGAGAIGAERLVREALRMRPDRLVVGECRGAEVRDLLSALNTGHDGGGGTMHANTLEDVPARLEALGALAGLAPSAIARQAVSAIGFVLHLERRADVRRLVQAGRLGLDARDRLRIDPVDPQLPLTAGVP